MAKALTLEEINDRWPSTNGAPVFKKWFNNLMKVAGVDLNTIFGEDKVAKIPTGKLYLIGLSKPSMALIRKTLPLPLSDKNML